MKRVQGFCKDNDWCGEKGGKLTVALHIDQILAELQAEPDCKEQKAEEIKEIPLPYPNYLRAMDKFFREHTGKADPQNAVAAALLEGTANVIDRLTDELKELKSDHIRLNAEAVNLRIERKQLKAREERLEKAIQISYEAICTGDQEASDKAIGLIDDLTKEQADGK